MSKIYLEKFCEKCNNKFIPKKIGKNHKGRFCSTVCFLSTVKKTRECPSCKIIFYHKENKFCSKICVSYSRTGEKNNFFIYGKIEKTCIVCEKKFQIFPSSKKKICSLECSRKNLSNNKKNKNSNYMGGKNIKCLVCDKEFWNCPSVNAKFCSRICFHKVRFGNGQKEIKTRWGYKSSKSGKREDLGIFVRSSWEANYARYLNFLKKHNQIKDWKYESETFEFQKIKKGTKFYTPDFKVTLLDETIEYHEVKGYMTKKGATAIKRMGIYYPKIKIILIQKKEYDAIKRQMAKSIENWE